MRQLSRKDRSAAMDIYHEILKKYWGYDNFRPLQEDIIHSVAAQKDTLGLMPTGGGKSLTFQIPAMAMEGLCIVVTPLIALMKDQVDNLRDKGIRALAVYSGMTNQEILTTLDNAIFGDFKFLYVSPERLGTKQFLQKVHHMNVCMLVVDESHCISQWGYDFRPSYLKISDIREHISEGAPILALTATATKEVVDDIQNQLKFRKKNVFSKSFERKNVAYIVRETETKDDELIRILERMVGSTIVYVRSRKRTKEISDFLNAAGFSADYYHAGLTSNEKDAKQNAWKDNHIRIIVCTNAFGMGIDKPDVRLVVHIDLPNAIEEYFQEAGRAGRDGEKSYAVILYHKTDATKLKKRVRDEFPERDFVLHVYDCLSYFYQVADGYGMDRMHDFNIHEFCKTYKLPILPTHNALKILHLSEYLDYQDEVNNKSRLMVLAYRNELYNLDLDTKSNEVLNTLLRFYTGLFASYVTINELEIGQKHQLSRREVYEILIYLAKRGIVDYIPHKKTPLVAYTQPRQESKYIKISRSVYETRQERFAQRIAAMCNYVQHDTVCRSKSLLEYFDEKVANDCGQCDVCLAKNKTGLKNWKFNEIELAIKGLLRDDISQLVGQITNTLSQYEKEDTIRVIRFLVERGDLVQELDGISLKS